MNIISLLQINLRERGLVIVQALNCDPNTVKDQMIGYALRNPQKVNLYFSYVSRNDSKIIPGFIQLQELRRKENSMDFDIKNLHLCALTVKQMNQGELKKNLRNKFIEKTEKKSGQFQNINPLNLPTKSQKSEVLSKKPPPQKIKEQQNEYKGEKKVSKLQKNLPRLNIPQQKGKIKEKKSFEKIKQVEENKNQTEGKLKIKYSTSDEEGGDLNDYRKEKQHEKEKQIESKMDIEGEDDEAMFEKFLSGKVNEKKKDNLSLGGEKTLKTSSTQNQVQPAPAKKKAKQQVPAGNRSIFQFCKKK